MKTDIIIVGAGAAGLMAARELAKAGKKVIILEAKDRIGGRIFSLDESEFGYQAQGGAEFVHGSAPVTKSLIKEAGLTYVLMPIDGEMWSFRNGEPVKNNRSPTQDPEFAPYLAVINEKLKALKEDLPIAGFLNEYFQGEKYKSLRDWITGMVKAYDAADPNKMSTFSLRDEWLSGGEWEQGRIKEGYGALLNFLESECKKNGIALNLNQEVKSIEMSKSGVQVICFDEKSYNAKKVILTLSLPMLKQINFSPPIPEKSVAASKIGFGGVVKILLRFKNRWWINAFQKDFSKLTFMVANGKVRVWWTQYPELLPVLIGWIPGPASEEFKHTSNEEILDLALNSLSDTFKIQRDILNKELVFSKVVNWLADPFVQGAYSYPTPETQEALAELVKPVDNKIFFAGEALFSGKETATVEGALASGLEVAKKILS